MLTPTNPLLLICMIWRAIFLPAVASGELRGQSKPWELVYPLAGCSVPTGRGPRGWGVLSCSLKHGRALEECFGTRNLLSSLSTINKSKPGLIPCGMFHLITYKRRGSVDVLDTSAPLAMPEEQHQGVPFPCWISVSRKENHRAVRKQQWKYHGCYVCLYYTTLMQTLLYEKAWVCKAQYELSGLE